MLERGSARDVFSDNFKVIANATATATAKATCLSAARLLCCSYFQMCQHKLIVGFFESLFFSNVPPSLFLVGVLDTHVI